MLKEIDILYSVDLHKDDLEVRELFPNGASNQGLDYFEPNKNTVLVNMNVFIFMVQALMSPEVVACEAQRWTEINRCMRLRGMSRSYSLCSLSIATIEALIRGIHPSTLEHAAMSVYEALLAIEYQRMIKDLETWQRVYEARLSKEARSNIAAPELQRNAVDYRAKLYAQLQRLQKNEAVKLMYSKEQLALEQWLDKRAAVLRLCKDDLIGKAL